MSSIDRVGNTIDKLGDTIVSTFNHTVDLATAQVNLVRSEWKSERKLEQKAGEAGLIMSEKNGLPVETNIEIAKRKFTETSTATDYFLTNIYHAK